MRLEEFKEWLQDKYIDVPTTVNNRISNCKLVEKYYNNLDTHFSTDKCKSLIEDFTYSTENERQNLPPKHIIPIDGNIRTGSATLKQAVKLYVEFCEFIQDETSPYVSIVSPEIIQTDEDGDLILNQLLSHIDEFQYDKKKYQDISVLQLDISDYLNVKFQKFKWDIEYKPSDSYKDSIDIIGLSDTTNIKVIIELDAHRADQVAKKYLSRLALSISDNIVYLALCYSGTKSMSKNECLKYFEYCNIIASNLSAKSDAKKFFAGRILGK
jgi:hypothetical protein